MGVYGVLRVEKLLKLAGGEGAEMVWFLLHLLLKAVMNLWRMLMILTTLGKEKALGKNQVLGVFSSSQDSWASVGVISCMQGGVAPGHHVRYVGHDKPFLEVDLCFRDRIVVPTVL